MHHYKWYSFFYCYNEPENRQYMFHDYNENGRGIE